jgi:hypothetical protein
VLQYYRLNISTDRKVVHDRLIVRSRDAGKRLGCQQEAETKEGSSLTVRARDKRVIA